MRVPTIRIKADNEQGFVIINESDFDENKMALYVPGKAQLLKEAEQAGVKVDGRSKPETILKKISKAVAAQDNEEEL